MMSKRVLVVDDDPALRNMLQAYLESCGHAVETAENGRDALTKLEQAEYAGYDAVVTDYSMPEVNGLAILRHIRQRQPSLPVVIMTGERRSHVAFQSLVALGAQACLFKPFDFQDLEQFLASIRAATVAS